MMLIMKHCFCTVFTIWCYVMVTAPTRKALQVVYWKDLVHFSDSEEGVYAHGPFIGFGSTPPPPPVIEIVKHLPAT
jgi:hypothetical protein